MEERLVDDDIGKTIVVKKKKDGTVEDVLEGADEPVDTEDTVAQGAEEFSSGEEEETEEIVFDMPVGEEDDEMLADMTPEEAAAFIKRREEEAAELEEKTRSLLAEAEAYLAEGNVDGAEERYYNVMELDPSHLEANAAYARIVTKDFSDYRDFAAVEEAYGRGVDHCGEDFTARIKEKCGKNISEEIRILVSEAEAVQKTVEEKKEKRRRAFRADYQAKRKIFFSVLLPLVVFVALTILFAVLIPSVSGAAFLVLACVSGAVAFILLVLFMIAANRLSNALHRVKENERDEATKDGRALIELKRKIDFLSEILA